MAPSNLIGGHCLVAGGLATGGLRYAAEIGAEVMQVFVSNPRGWALSEGKADEDARLRESGIPVYVHASYLVNFGSPNPATLENSGASIRHALRRAAEIYAERFSDPDGRVRATFEFIFLSGWAPHESQQQPAEVGAAAKGAH